MPAELDVAVRVARPRQGFTLDATLRADAGLSLVRGPSGAGKSTLLAAIAGLIPATGSITVGGEAWLRDGVSRPVHLRRVGVVFQSLALFPHLTALENVAYGVREPSREARERAARAALARWKIAHAAEQRPGTLSGGEAQRVALARAFAQSPRLLLLDEPLSALDRPLRRQLFEEIRAAVAELGIVALHVTHDEEDAGDHPSFRVERGRVAREPPAPR